MNGEAPALDDVSPAVREEVKHRTGLLATGKELATGVGTGLYHHPFAIAGAAGGYGLTNWALQPGHKDTHKALQSLINENPQANQAFTNVQSGLASMLAGTRSMYSTAARMGKRIQQTATPGNDYYDNASPASRGAAQTVIARRNEHHARPGAKAVRVVGKTVGTAGPAVLGEVLQEAAGRYWRDQH
jgi:hypothetical protein